MRDMTFNCVNGHAEIVKSLNDKREYRLIVLNNGLRALLISDLDGFDQSTFEKEIETDEESVSSCSSDDEENDIDDYDEEECEEKVKAGEKKSAAALCIGVGSFSDPDDIPGFAHFLEHMVFLGSEKYPKENCLDDFLSRHGGDTNANTDYERTSFYFDVDRDYFHKALDKFAHFFVSPLLTKNCVDREIEAVDSEFQESIRSDEDRLTQLLCTKTGKPGNPMVKFVFGNADTLKRIPAEKGIDVYGRLRDFFNRYYTAQYMTLAVHSKHTLDTLEQWVKESFGGIHNNQEAPLTFAAFKDPFDTPEFRKIYKVIAVQKTHKVYLTWSFPPLQHLYREKPYEYVSTLLTHEGEGSIYSDLKKRTWALDVYGGNSGDGFDMNTMWTGLDICITMTDEGFKNVNWVIKVVFEYINMLKMEGPQQWFYDQLKMLEDITFRWKEPGDPTDYVEIVSDCMHKYPPKDYLTGDNLLFHYDAQVLKEFVGNLRADNCNVMIVSNTFTEEQCTETEPWFGTRYCVEDITPELLSFWTDSKIRCALHLEHPKSNNFLPTDFDLKVVLPEDLSPYPKIVSSSPFHRLFYKKDTKFNVPKGYVYIHLKSHVVCDSIKSSSLLDLFTNIVNQNIAEPTYPAVLAGYEIGIAVDKFQTGMLIQVDGFNSKIQAVLDAIIDVILKFDCSDELFEAMKAQLKKRYHNIILKPRDACRGLRFLLLEKRYYPVVSKLVIVDDLTKNGLMEFAGEFLSHLHVECLIMGNFTKQEATNISDDIISRLNCQKIIDESLITNNLLQLPVQKTYCQIRSFNPEDTNSCITNYYQSRPGSLLTCCLNEVLVTCMVEPCFATLRTKLQLGYTVNCTNHLTCGIVGISILVECQAYKFSTAFVDEQIENFLLQMDEILKKMTLEEFNTLINSVIMMKKTEDTHLEEEVLRHWLEITDGTYVFDRLEKEIEILQSLTLKSLQDWFTGEYLGDNQRKISIQVVGSDGNATDKPNNDLDYMLVCLCDPEQCHSVPVQDVHHFRSDLKLLPYTRV